MGGSSSPPVPAGLVDGDPLHDPAADREADEVRSLDAEAVEDPDCVGDEVIPRVARLARR